MNKFKAYFSQHESQIFLGMGLALIGGSIYQTITATIKATRVVDAKKKEIQEQAIVEVPEEDLKVPVKEIIKDTWKYYLSAGFLFTTGVIFIVKSFVGEEKDKIELMTSCLLAENAANRYKQEAIEQAGEAKDRKIEKEQAIHHQENTPVTPENVYATGNGNTLYFIDYLGIYFRSSPEVVNDAILKFCRRCDSEGMSVSELLSSLEVNAKHPLTNDYYGQRKFVGDQIGWNDNDKLEITVEWTNSGLEPCGVIIFGGKNPWPHLNFWG